jgi:hypothetical protein
VPVQIRTGLDVLERQGFAPLTGAVVGLVTNQTGIDAEGRRAIDLFAGATNLRLHAIFSPEHGITGDANTAVAFNGTSGKVSFGDAFDYAAKAAFSLEAWVQPSVVDATSRRIFSKETSDVAGAQGYYLVSNSTRVSFARLRDDNYETLSGPAMVAGARYHVVVTYDGTWMRLYINGVQVDASPSANSLLDTTALFTVGAKSSGGGEWGGAIDEPAVYRQALSASMVMAHYQAGL